MLFAHFVFDYTVKTKAAVINTPTLIVAPNAYVILGTMSHNKMMRLIVTECLSLVSMSYDFPSD